jgi:hypothetical protein
MSHARCEVAHHWVSENPGSSRRWLWRLVRPYGPIADSALLHRRTELRTSTPRRQSQHSHLVATLAERARTESSNTLTPIRVIERLDDFAGVVRLALSDSTACCPIMDRSSERRLPDRIGYSRTSKMSHGRSWHAACRIRIRNLPFRFGHS